jgi:hypothetical protein
MVEIAVQLIDNATPQVPATLDLLIEPADNLEYVLRSPVVASMLILDDDLLSPASINGAFSSADGVVDVDLLVYNPTDSDAVYHAVLPGGYHYIDSTMDAGLVYEWIDIADPASAVSFNWVFPSSDGITPAIDIGFAFPFYDSKFSTVHIQSNGFITFQNVGGTLSSNWPLPDNSPRSPANLIAAFWRNFGLDAQTKVYARQLPGSFIVQYTDMIANPQFGGMKARTTFQIILHPNGVITLQYKSNDTGNAGTIGIQNATKSAGLLVSHNQAYIRSELAVRLIPPTAFVGIPAGAITIPAGGQVTTTVSIDTRFLPYGVWQSVMELHPEDPALPLLKLPIDIDMPAPSPVWQAALPTGDGLVWSHWFGRFHDLGNAHDWIYSPQMDLLYCHQGDATGLWMWSVLLDDHVWAASGFVPYYYSARYASWIYPSTGFAAAYFYVFNLSKWIAAHQF